VTLELNKLTETVQAMGRELAANTRERANLVDLAREWLVTYADQGDRLQQPARSIHAAIPTAEPMNAVFPQPALPSTFTIIGADGSQIQPDRHAAALYYLINVGSIVYRHGSGQAPETHSEPSLGYKEDDLYEQGRLVAGNLLDVRRDLAEVTTLADRCEEQQDGPIVALVDGTLLLWILEDRTAEWQRKKVDTYTEQLRRIQQVGPKATVASFTSRPRRTEVTRLLYLASADGDAERARQSTNPLERVPDRWVFATLPPGARSALFVSPAPINHEHYAPEGQTIHFFYLNVAREGEKPAIARIECPEWVAAERDLLDFVHGAVVDQARITGEYPYALARADELAFVSGRERRAFAEMVNTALLSAGVIGEPSPKAYQKTLTRRGRRRIR